MPLQTVVSQRLVGPGLARRQVLRRIPIKANGLGLQLARNPILIEETLGYDEAISMTPQNRGPKNFAQVLYTLDDKR